MAVMMKLVKMIEMTFFIIELLPSVVFSSRVLCIRGEQIFQCPITQYSESALAFAQSELSVPQLPGSLRC